MTSQVAPDLREAARLDQAGRCAEAEPIYRQALSAPTPAVLNNAANHYLVCGDAVRARELFQSLVRRVPAHSNANLQLAKLARSAAEAAPYLGVLSRTGDAALLLEIGTVYARLGDFKSAQQSFERAAAAAPGAFEPLWLLGRAAARNGDLPRACEALAAARKLQPEHPGVLSELGRALAANGDPVQAVYVLSQAAQRQPADAAVALALARAAEDAGFFGDAALAYDRYLAFQPLDEAAARDRARALASVPGREAEGMEYLERYVDRHPQDATGHFQLAQTCWKAEPERSLRHLEESVLLDPRQAQTRLALAWLLRRQGREREALPHLEAAVKLQPKAARAHDQYGLALQSLDRVKEAEAAFRRAVTLAPRDWESRLHLGRILAEQGRVAESRQWLTEYERLRPARQRDPRREPGMIELATLPPEAGRAREIERLMALVKSRPDDPLLRLQLGRLLLADSRAADAVREFRPLLASADASTLKDAGRALAASGDPENALEFLEKAGARVEYAAVLFSAYPPQRALAALDAVPPGERTSDYTLLRARVLESLGREKEALQLITGTHPGASPGFRVEAALLLTKHRLFGEALQLLRVSGLTSDRDVALAEALTLALAAKTAEAEAILRRLALRWPEWDRPLELRAVLRKTATNSACPTLERWLDPACRGVSPW